MTISWDPPAIDQRNGNITYYRAILTPLQPGEPKLDQNVGVFFLLISVLYLLIFALFLFRRMFF